MRRILLIATYAILARLGHLLGQGLTLAGAGFTNPSIIRVAPGQITTIFVTGLKTVLASSPVNAAVVPLPTTLAGISVTLNRTTPLPLLSIQQMTVCPAAPPPPIPTSPSSPPSPDCLITSVTVQIPFDLPLPGGKATATELVVSENGTASETFQVYPISDNLHVNHNVRCVSVAKLRCLMCTVRNPRQRRSHHRQLSRTTRRRDRDLGVWLGTDESHAKGWRSQLNARRHTLFVAVPSVRFPHECNAVTPLC